MAVISVVGQNLMDYCHCIEAQQQCAHQPWPFCAHKILSHVGRNVGNRTHNNNR